MLLVTVGYLESPVHVCSFVFLKKIFVSLAHLAASFSDAFLFFYLAFSAPLGIIFFTIHFILPAISALSLTHTTALLVSVCLHGNDLGHACVVEEREHACSDNRKRHILMINSNLVSFA